MVRINRIYTRSGDQGKTHLVGGSMVEKNSLRVAAYGDLDELNAQIGLIVCSAQEFKQVKLVATLLDLQQRLFDLGAQLATPAGQEVRGSRPIIVEDVTHLEQLIDQACSDLPELKSFVLPGGHQLNAQLHLARTVCRRFERSLVALMKQEPLGEHVLEYVNRLSDLFFALARRSSADLKVPEVLWDPKRE